MYHAVIRLLHITKKSFTEAILFYLFISDTLKTLLSFRCYNYMVEVNVPSSYLFSRFASQK